MPTETPALKRHNHRVHPCLDDKKEELLKVLIEKNHDKKIIVVTSAKTELTSELENVSILSDEELLTNKELRCEMLISYDLPSKAIIYMARLAHTETFALALVTESQEKLLHPIETLVGRTIMQENMEGFSPERVEKQAQPSKKDFAPREERAPRKDFKSDKKPWDKDKKDYNSDRKPREDRGDKKPWDKDKKEFKSDKKTWDKDKKDYNSDRKPREDRGERKPWDKKDKEESRYIGKDENGKSIFSGKSGERNHRYDGTPKGKPTRLTGKKISIKDLKKKD